MDDFTYVDKINLHVKDRISETDAARQMKTAKEILKRLQDQPGLILADEVGTGKTFVALAVAASIVLNNLENQIVVMVPPSLRDKWPRDFVLFKEKCVPIELQDKLSCAVADSSVDFLKLLDDPPERRKSLIFLTHGAMTRGITDNLVKLALIKTAITNRKNTDALKNALYKFAGKIISMGYLKNRDNEIWEKLLKNDFCDWRKILRKSGIISDDVNSMINDDDPIPAAIVDALNDINSDAIYQALLKMPIRESKNFENNMKDVRKEINDELKNVWKICIQKLKIELPLLIFDEAHHLKNSDTRIASLFQTESAKDDAEEIDKGPLAEVFKRMLFLTATPFQLGHHELCSVLDRFSGICWKGQKKEAKDEYLEIIDSLKKSLNTSQQMAMSLDLAWGKLETEDLIIDAKPFTDIYEWWSNIKEDSKLTEDTSDVYIRYRNAEKAMRDSEKLLKPWVIRNIKDKKMIKPQDNTEIPRRELYNGAAILDDNMNVSTGLALNEKNILPFLLASRAAACNPDNRPVFAEGLSSSYEAFRHTSAERLKKSEKLALNVIDMDDDIEETDVGIKKDTQDASDWYLKQLDKMVNPKLSFHPKIDATIKRAMELWHKGEKVLIFCHYIRTGRSLRQHISKNMEERILYSGAEKLNCKTEEVLKIIEKISSRLEKDSPMKRIFDTNVDTILDQYVLLKPHENSLKSIINRYSRTPSFLVRFYPLEKPEAERYNANLITDTFSATDASGMSFSTVLKDFFDFLTNRCGTSERKDYIDALDSIQRSSHVGIDVMKTFSPDEIPSKDEKLLANVRLINGQSKPPTRKKLMLAFNTPFYPEILICSSVMAEGVDLQMNCRHVIHHDLCWNPSTLEQRTGRIDRIGGKVERSLKPIKVYMPFISETQDQKMFEVVMDRERWFKVVMGEKYKVDLKTTEKHAERLPLPEQLADELAFKIGLE